MEPKEKPKATLAGCMVLMLLLCLVFMLIGFGICSRVTVGVPR